MKQDRMGFYAKILLFVTAFIWGSTFVVVKGAADSFSPAIMIAIRFTVSVLILSAIFHKKLKQLSRVYIRSGIIMGFFLFCSYYLQVLGLSYGTTPGKSAFLTAVYCILIPFFSWFIYRQRPDRYSFIAAFLCIGGIGFVSITENFYIAPGDFVTLLGGVFTAANIVATARFSYHRDPVVLSIVQLGTVAAFAIFFAFLFEDIPAMVTASSVIGVLYLAVFATAVCFLLQGIGLKYTNPTAASIILCLESVFGVLFSILFYGEQITIRLFLGFCFIFISILLSETKLSFLGQKKKDLDHSKSV